MPLNTQQQILQQFEGANSILIALPQRPGTDAVVSALTLSEFLLSQNKTVKVVGSKFIPSSKLSFINNLDQIESDIGAITKTAVSLNVKKYPTQDIRYHVQDDTLEIFITPKDGSLPKEAIQISDNVFLYDLIVVINTAELPSLGDLYNQYKNLFFGVPLINIDHRPDNEQFGQINWVNINATSTSEMMYDFLYKENTPSKNSATALLAGMMSETHSFRTHQVTPTTLHIVSKLMDSGADHETIVNNLYRTKTVGLLKLWGHVLENLQSDRELALAWSLIPASVFKTTGTDHTHLQDLMMEILNHSPEAKTVVLFIEEAKEHSTVEIQVTTRPPMHAKDLIKDRQPIGGEKVATAIIKGTTLKFAEDEVIPSIKKRLKQLQ